MTREINVRVWIKPEQRYADNKNDEIHYHRWCDMKSGGWYVTTAKDVLYEGDDIIVEQDTGLKDKNGKKIYEGNIVQDSKGVKCRVEWDTKEAQFGLYVGKQMKLTDFIWMRGEDLEIIGNVHKNKELLDD